MQNQVVVMADRLRRVYTLQAARRDLTIDEETFPAGRLVELRSSDTGSRDVGRATRFPRHSPWVGPAQECAINERKCLLSIA